MSDSRQGPSRADSADAGPQSEPVNPQSAATIQPGPKNEAVFGPFTARDLAIFGGVLVTFIGSLLPLVQRAGALNVWNGQNLYFIAIGILLPIVLAGLFVWRRLAPEASIRVGSLSLDQFASVVAVLTCSYYFLFAVTVFSAGGIVGFVGGAVLVAATLFARAIPLFAGDFLGRAEVPAHVVARDAVAPAPKPAAGKSAAGQPAGAARVTPWASPSVNDDGRAPHEGEAGVSSAGAAAAASGVAGAAAAGAGVAALAAGAMAAEAGSREAEGSEPEPKQEQKSASVADIVAAVHGEPEADAEHPAESGLVAGGPEAAGHEAAAGTAAPDAAAETAPAAAATAPGEADGEAYGAPEPKAEPKAEAEANHTTVLSAAKAADAEDQPATQATSVVDRSSGHEASRNFDESPADYEAFWFAVNQQRTAVDPQSGLPMFNLEPGQWILALQDRGDEFLVQSQDGRVGVLRDLSGIERG
ncbi:hypothetical protein [Sinomonas albida]|uniref:hypothetical protein n=1 Tax=Sinomonas albida TaxID=369942 RepID=UPI0030194F20